MARISPALLGLALVFGAATSGESIARDILRELDVPANRAARTALQRALETRAAFESERWQVAGVAEGSVTPIRTWRSTSGHWCREFEQRVQLADGREHRTIAVRCRSEDGRWLKAGD